MKKIFLICLLAIFLQTTASAETLEWTSGQLGGGWYTMSSGLAKIIEEANPDLKIKVVPGGGTANPSKIEKGRSQFGMGLDCLAFLANEGKDIYKGKPHKNLMMIGGSLSDTLFHFVKADGAEASFEQVFTDAKKLNIGVTKVMKFLKGEEYPEQYLNDFELFEDFVVDEQFFDAELEDTVYFKKELAELYHFLKRRLAFKGSIQV